MTEMEAEALAARLTKAWGINSDAQWRLKENREPPLLHFAGFIREDIKFEAHQSYDGDVSFYLLTFFSQGKTRSGQLRFLKVRCV